MMFDVSEDDQMTREYARFRQGLQNERLRLRAAIQAILERREVAKAERQARLQATKERAKQRRKYKRAAARAEREARGAVPGQRQDHP